MEELMNRCKIMETKSGSHLYGLNTEKSDEDYVGIFLATEEYVYGLKNIEQVDLSITSKDSRGKNTSEAIDRKFYELKRFVRLSLDGNPNILELLFANKSSIIYQSKSWDLLYQNRYLFLSKKLIPKFLGYGKSMERKLLIQSSKLDCLLRAYDYLIEQLKQGKDKITLPELIGNKEFDSIFKEAKDKLHFNIGKYTINRNITIKSAKKWLEEFISNESNRIENIKVNGYDFKSASHLLRLLYQVNEILETGDLQYPLKDKELLLSIKNGYVSFEKFNELLNEAYDKLRKTEEITNLPTKPNYEEVEKLVIKIYKNWIEKGDK